MSIQELIELLLQAEKENGDMPALVETEDGDIYEPLGHSIDIDAATGEPMLVLKVW